MESPATGQAQPSSMLSGFARPAPKNLTQPAPPSSGEEAESPLSAEDARALAAEGMTRGADSTGAQKARGEGDEEKDPIFTYEDRVKLFGLTVNQALEIIDALAVNGDWREGFQVSKAVKVMFSTRSARFNSYLADRIDIADPKKVGKLNQMMVEYQIAGSLVSYAEKSMPELNDHLPQEQWEAVLKKRLDFVKLLPSPVFLLLSNKLAKFDAKMMVVFSEGYEQNF